MRAAALIAVVIALSAGPTAALAATSAEQRAQVQRLERELAQLDVQVGAAAADANRAIDRAEQLRDQVRETRRELARTARAQRAGQDRLAARLRALYVRPDPSLGALLVTGAPLGTVLETRRVLDQAARRDGRMVTLIRERRAELTGLRAELERASADAEREAARAAQARDRVTRTLRARQEVLNGARSTLRRLLREERAARATTARQHSSGRPVRTAPAPALPLPGGSHVFPVAGPTRFTDDWLYPRPGGRYHQGIDLFAERGTPLVAVSGGTVYRVGWNTLGGWRLWLRDSGGTTYYYAHLESFAPAASEGAAVAAGTVLGYMGDSGSARGTGVHLHFEIHPGGGAPVRPWPYVTSWPRVG